MGDGKLLSLAAKAAGAKWTDYSDRTPDHWEIKHANGSWRPWNPLTDDGDAFRLALQLRIRFARHCQPFVAAFAPDVVGRFEEPEGDDLYAATRRAIVRAAAEIGRAM